MKQDYPIGNLELLQLFKTVPFDAERAEQIITEIEDLNAPIIVPDDCSNPNGAGYSMTYLYKAQELNNVKACELLLKHGADPNYVNEDLNGDCALWELQYMNNDPNDESEVELRYEIAKLFFQYGADPNIDPDNSGDSLYYYVEHKPWLGQTECQGKVENNLLGLMYDYMSRDDENESEKL